MDTQSSILAAPTGGIRVSHGSKLSEKFLYSENTADLSKAIVQDFEQANKDTIQVMKEEVYVGQSPS